MYVVPSSSGSGGSAEVARRGWLPRRAVAGVSTPFPIHNLLGTLLLDLPVVRVVFLNWGRISLPPSILYWRGSGEPGTGALALHAYRLPCCGSSPVLR